MGWKSDGFGELHALLTEKHTNRKMRHELQPQNQIARRHKPLESHLAERHLQLRTAAVLPSRNSYPLVGKTTYAQRRTRKANAQVMIESKFCV